MSTVIFILVLLHLLAGFGYAIYKINFSSKNNSDPSHDQ
jgi:hypothetical protein